MNIPLWKQPVEIRRRETRVARLALLEELKANVLAGTAYDVATPARHSTTPASPWTTFIAEAGHRTLEPIQLPKSNRNLTAPRPFNDELLDNAMEKSVRTAMQHTGLNRIHIQGEIVRRLRADHAACRSPIAAIRFLRDVDPAWWIECEHCGAENDPPWDVCAKCGAAHDG